MQIALEILGGLGVLAVLYFGLRWLFDNVSVKKD